MMNRLFTFGCSFTAYIWPTWADMIGKKFDHHENWGQSGTGNHAILQTLTECIVKKNVSPDDTIMISWSGVDRHDYFKDGRWKLLSVRNDNALEDFYIKNLYDEYGMELNTCNAIVLAKRMLDGIGCMYKMTSIFGVEPRNECLANVYKDYLDTVDPSFLDVLFNGSFMNRHNDLFINGKKQRSRKEIKKIYNECRGEDWPSFNEFIHNGESDFLHETLKFFGVDNFNDIFHAPDYDYHPTPLMHYEFIQKQYPEYTSTETEQWAKKVNDMVFADLWDHEAWKHRIIPNDRHTECK